jgi:heme-degrading monooxygenase HmoA
MILEAAILKIKAGQGKAFEAALREALPLIEATPGFRGLEICPCVEKLDQYLLLVRWDKLEDHTIGFRESERYPKWRAALHHFYDPFPTVLHYEEPV